MEQVYEEAADPTFIQALLEYSTSNNKANPPRRKVDLSQLFDQVASDLEGPAQLREVILERGELPVLKVVPEQFRQLFSNLISTGSNTRVKATSLPMFESGPNMRKWKENAT